MKNVFKFKLGVVVAAVLALQVGQFVASSERASALEEPPVQNATTKATLIGLPVAASIGGSTVLTLGLILAYNVPLMAAGVGISVAGGVTLVAVQVAAMYDSYNKEMFVKQIQEDSAQCLTTGCEEPSALLSSMMDKVRQATAEQFGQAAADSLTSETIAEGLLAAEIR